MISPANDRSRRFAWRGRQDTGRALVVSRNDWLNLQPQQDMDRHASGCSDDDGGSFSDTLPARARCVTAADAAGTLAQARRLVDGRNYAQAATLLEDLLSKPTPATGDRSSICCFGRMTRWPVRPRPPEKIVRRRISWITSPLSRNRAGRRRYRQSSRNQSPRLR